MQETQVRSLGQEDVLEKKMATHSSVLAREIPWTKEPRGYSPWGGKRNDLSTKQHFQFKSSWLGEAKRFVQSD